MDYKIKIQRQRRRNLMMRRIPGGIEVFIPHYLKPTSIEVKNFIAEGLAKFEGQMLPIPAEQTSADEILRMVDDWSRRISVQPKRVQMREMRRKWGSCSNRSIVTLNVALRWLPRHLAEYVVCHELVHLIELNHGAGFQALMTTHMPDWRERERELDSRRIGAV
jgi:predicted metal-dependent hydrolase